MATPGPSHTPLMATFYRILPGIVKLFWGAVLVGKDQPLILSLD